MSILFKLLYRQLSSVIILLTTSVLLAIAGLPGVNGIIKGKVRSNEGKHVDGASIKIKGIAGETISEEDGTLVDNLTNQTYCSFRLAPQLPARATANITFRF